ncbi:MAG: ribosome recycling factor [Minisyncoccia bacterium]
MAYDFNIFKNKVKEVEDWLHKEYQGIRTGQASPMILDGVRVEAYGQMSPVNQVAGITTEGARSLRVVPWDNSVLKALEKAIQVANLGVSVMSDDKGIRVNFPELTSETRTTLLKLAKSKLEDARISLRSARTDTLTDLDKKKDDGLIGEDDHKRNKVELQKYVDDSNLKLEEVFARKEKEISL